MRSLSIIVLIKSRGNIPDFQKKYFECSTVGLELNDDDVCLSGIKY